MRFIKFFFKIRQKNMFFGKTEEQKNMFLGKTEEQKNMFLGKP